MRMSCDTAVSVKKRGFWGDKVADGWKVCVGRTDRARRAAMLRLGSPRRAAYRGIVMHLVLMFWVVMAFSSSSSCPVFFSFLTRLFTAFSHHFSSWPFCSPFFHPKSRLTMGGVKGKIDILSWVESLPGVEKSVDVDKHGGGEKKPRSPEGPGGANWSGISLETNNRGVLAASPAHAGVSTSLLPHSDCRARAQRRTVCRQATALQCSSASKPSSCALLQKLCYS